MFALHLRHGQQGVPVTNFLQLTNLLDWFM